MIANVQSIGLHGLNAQEVQVEVDVVTAQFLFQIVGLADTAVQEAKERIRSAIRNSEFAFPNRRIIVNLAPAFLRKQSPGFDLPMAVGILIASGQVESQFCEGALFIGELSLNGTIQSVLGALSMALFAKQKGYRRIFVPWANRYETAVVEGMDIFAVKNLKEVVHILQFQTTSPYYQQALVGETYKNEVFGFLQQHENDHGNVFSSIKGQVVAKRALEIAAAGGHNILFNGPPGSGKTMLARALQSLLPSMSLKESIEVTQIYSVSGLLPNNGIPLLVQRPFRTVHHTASSIALVGGGRFPKPGEISLAHKGILFLDEIAEFPQDVLEVLRQPMEDRVMTISRTNGTHSYPASFTLVAAMNPCPCGYATDKEKECTCSESHIQRYQRKLSGPLLDRIDIFLEIPRLSVATMVEETGGDSDVMGSIKNRIYNARQRQLQRFETGKVSLNAEMTNRDVHKFCICDQDAKVLLEKAVEDMKLSPRSYFRILKLTRTMADLDDTDHIEKRHVAEALRYRKRW